MSRAFGVGGRAMARAGRGGVGGAPESGRLERRLAAALACAVTLAVSAPAGAQPPAPVVERWYQAIGAVRESSPLPVALGGDRSVVVGALDARVYALRASNGAPARGWPQATTSPINASPSAADTDGDGREEVFVGVGTDYQQNGGFYSFAGDGRRRFRFQPADESNGNLSVHSTAAIGDVNADGVPDVTWGALGLKMWSLDHDGGVNRGWPVYTDETVFSSPALADVDGDGVTDIVVGIDSTPGGPVDFRGGAIWALSGTGRLLWEFRTDEMMRSSPSVGDVDGDGRPEIVFGTGNYWVARGGSQDATKLFVLSADGRLKWKKDLGGQTLGSPALADIDGDGRLDIAQGTWEGANPGQVWALRGNGTALPGYPRASGGGVVIGGITTADLDGDGAQDLLVPTGGGVFAYSGRGGSRLFALFEGKASFQNSPLVGDLDGNGLLDIVVAGERPQASDGRPAGGLLARFELTSPAATAGARGWPMFRKDVRRTGSWTNPPLTLAPRGKPPGAPRDVLATAGDGAVTVTWRPPEADGGSPITAYLVESSAGTQVRAPGDARSATMAGLPDGRSVTFRVRAENAAGPGPFSVASPPVVVGRRPAGPALDVRPPAVDFGEVPAGESNSQQLTLVSTGGAPLVLGRLAVEGGGGAFELVDDSCSGRTLATGASCTANLAFRARPGAATEAALVVPSNVPARSVPLRAATRAPLVLEVSPASVRLGERVQVSGRGFRRTVEVFLDERRGSALATAEPDAEGGFTATVTLGGTNAGGHRLLACERDGPCASAPLRLTAAGRGAVPPAALAGALLVTALAVLALLRLRGRGVAGGAGAGGGSAGSLPVPSPHERAVRTGFCDAADVTKAVDPADGLAAGRAYHFWVEIGPAVSAGAGSGVLTVALFDYDGELVVEPGADLGAFELTGTDAHPLVQGATVGVTPANRELVERRVFFPVTAPRHAGAHRLRFSLYTGNVLLQSRVVTAEVRRVSLAARLLRAVTSRPARRPALISTEVDFTLSRTLDPAHLERLAPHDLSVMMNHSGGATHGFRLVGAGGFKSSATFDDAELQVLGDQVRTVLHEVACEKSARLVYRYDRPGEGQLTADLVRLARCGYRIYDALVDRLAAGVPGREPPERRLTTLLQGSRRIQFVNKMGARHRLPASVIYDAPLDTDLPDLTLCNEFAAAVAAGLPLERTECFRTRCPHWRARGVVCPSGFWGFRHVIGMPQSLGESDLPDVVTDVVFDDAPTVVVAVSTDAALTRRADHERALRELCPGARWQRAERRREALDVLAETQPHLVYFYCHGGSEGGVPYLELGPPGDTVLTGDNLRAYDVYWDESHPLVFVNGCHTTAVSPQTALELVTAFVQRQAAGVIGTEVSVFEPLACRFAEELLRRVVRDGEPVGDAVRAARLALLGEGNPLGLVYVPFVTDDLRIVPADRQGRDDERAGRVPGGTTARGVE